MTYAEWNTRVDRAIVDEAACNALYLSVRATNVLFTKFGFHPTVNELCGLSSGDILKTRNCGKKTIDEIITQLKKCGRRLSGVYAVS